MITIFHIQIFAIMCIQYTFEVIVVELNYIAIGQRVRSVRTKRKLSQEQLAHKVELTPAHISHIENGLTKVSLPSLVAIANALKVTADELLYDNIEVARDSYDKDFKDLVKDCSAQEKKIILEAAQSLKNVLKNKT